MFQSVAVSAFCDWLQRNFVRTDACYVTSDTDCSKSICIKVHDCIVQLGAMRRGEPANNVAKYKMCTHAGCVKVNWILHCKTG